MGWRPQGWEGLRCALLAAWALSVHAEKVLAQSASASDCANAPSFLSMRYEEDWSFMRDARCTTDPMDRLKYMRLGVQEDRYFSLGGEARWRFERFANPGFGAELEDNSGYWMQRYLLHGDLHLSKSVRVFGQSQSSLIHGRAAGPRPTDKDELDVEQLFVDWTWRGARRDFFTARAGRQEIEFGSARLVTARDGLNDRLSFDGVRLVGRKDRLRYGMWLTRPSQTKPGVFDDSSDRTQTFSAAYVAFSPDDAQRTSTSIYYLDRKRDVATYDQGAGSEDRHTFGVRLWGAVEGWDYNSELGYQFGAFDRTDIDAWFLATDTGYTLGSRKLRPRFGVRFDVSSGDRNRADKELNTFNPLFASTAFSGLVGLIGPGNAIDVAPSVTLQLNAQLRLTAGAIRFWRQDRADGIYQINGNLLRGARGSDARHVGDQATLQMVWNPSRHWSVSSTGAYFRAGEFLKETGAAKNVTYFTSWVTYRF